MFDYTKKQFIFITIVLILLVFAVTLMVMIERSRYQDLQAVNQNKMLATGLEKYYDHFNTYPAIVETDVSRINSLTDQGFNQPGTNIYYRRFGQADTSATILSSASGYIIKFNLKNRWPLWGLSGLFGGRCSLTNNLTLACGK